ncbi:hypothetical protein, partial [Streptomyces sp. NPDC005009]
MGTHPSQEDIRPIGDGPEYVGDLRPGEVTGCLEPPEGQHETVGLVQPASRFRQGAQRAGDTKAPYREVLEVLCHLPGSSGHAGILHHRPFVMPPGDGLLDGDHADPRAKTLTRGQLRHVPQDTQYGSANDVLGAGLPVQCPADDGVDEVQAAVRQDQRRPLITLSCGPDEFWLT